MENTTKTFDPSKYPKNIQELCKRDEEPPYTPDLLVEEIDYKSIYSLTEADIPHLVEIAVRLSEVEDHFSDKYAFAPANAWGALVSFASPQLLPTILDAINKIDWLHSDFGYGSILKVLARSAIDDPSLLIAAVHDESRHDSTRETIISVLEQLQKIRPEYRTPLIEALTVELSKLRIGYRDFYVHIASTLAEMDARESLPLIEEAYRQRLIDPECPGWMESIRKKLGSDAVSDPENEQFESEMDEVGKIVFRLDNCCETFPKETLLKAREYRNALIPSLIETIRQATAYARYDVPAEGGAHIFAVHLLAEFQAKEALPAIFESLSITDDQAWELYSDSYYEGMPGILYRIIGDDLDVYDRRIRDSKTPYPLRRSLLEALPYFVKNKVLDRESYIALMRDYFRLTVDEKNEDLIRETLDLLLDGGDKSDIPMLKEADRKGLIDDEFIGMDHAIAELSKDGSGFAQSIERRTINDYSDTIAEMEDWAWFKPERKYTPPPSLSRPSYQLPFPNDLLGKTKKVGRNDPCPCGSGKKYKRCCGK